MSKVSAQFAARLARSKPDRKLHAVVMLATPASAQSGNRRTREERQLKVREIRASASQALAEIDEILARHDGRRLSEQPTALGTITVEATAAGLNALADSERVSAILEDQPVSQVM
jgi:sorbitol-specific phosphotransferase system component IIA